MKLKNVTQIILFSVLSIVLLLSPACSRSTEKYIAAGNEFFSQGKYNEALIEFRNAL